MSRDIWSLKLGYLILTLKDEIIVASSTERLLCNNSIYQRNWLEFLNLIIIGIWLHYKNFIFIMSSDNSLVWSMSWRPRLPLYLLKLSRICCNFWRGISGKNNWSIQCFISYWIFLLIYFHLDVILVFLWAIIHVLTDDIHLFWAH